MAAVALGVLAGCDGPARQDAPPPKGAEGPVQYVEFDVSGTFFAPKIELVEDSAADVVWIDLATGHALGNGLSPSLGIDGVQHVGMRAEVEGAPAFDQITTLNLGFNHEDDYGPLSLPSAYNHDAQPVTGIGGLHQLTSLQRFCASRGPLAGVLDVSGLSLLEHVECYQSQLTGIDLTGCSSLVRLCVEDCQVTELDLNPVRKSLQDLRAAIQRAAGLAFVPLEGAMESLYHYCVREQVVHGHIPHKHLPVVEEYWVWGTGQNVSDAPTSTLLRSYLARDNVLDQQSVDGILLAIHELVEAKPGRVDLSGGSATPTTAGVAAADALSAAGWRVTTG